MDNEPGPECRAIAVIELRDGGAAMKVAQADADGLTILEHLRHRTPYALLGDAIGGAAREAALDDVRELLGGFARAACDYGVVSMHLVINGLCGWREDIACAARELGMSVFTPDERQCVDMTLAAAGGEYGDGCALFVIPGGSSTWVVADNESIYCKLPVGMDTGRYSNLHILTRGGALLRRRDGLSVRALACDEMRACVRRLEAPSADAYRLLLCIDFPDGVLAPGGYTARQLARRADELTQELTGLGAEPGYVTPDMVDDEPYRIACMRRAVNVLWLAGELCSRLGCGGADVVRASALDAALYELTLGSGCIDNAGSDMGRALCGAEQCARRSGSDTWQSVTGTALTMLDALSDAFAEDELPGARELLRLAAVLDDCDGAAEELPGLTGEERSRLTAICAACRLRDNDDVYHRLTPVWQEPEDELFAAEQESGDEFAPGDEDGASGISPDADYDDDASGQDEAEPLRAATVHERLRSPAVRGAPLELRLAAVLLVARALYIVGSGRMTQVSARLGGRGLTVKAVQRGGAALETLEFRHRSRLFKRVFGIRARLKPDKRR